MAGVTAVLLAFFLAIYPYRGFRLPVGSDAPVYLWWSRLAAHEHLNAVGTRAGFPALALMLAGSLHVSLVQVLAGIGAALAVSTGLAALALVRTSPELPLRGARARSVAASLAAVLAGTFAVHLAGGYFANLAFVAIFLAASALLATPARTGPVAACGLLAAGVLVHPAFFLVGAAILALTALPTVVRRPAGQRLRETEGGRILGALAAGAALGGAALAAIVVPDGAYRPDTSKDAFLRRVGLRGDVRSDYFDRFVRHLARYWLPISIPLSAVAALRSGGFLGRLLRAWGVVAIAGVLGGLATGLVPADRFITFAYVLPIGSAIAIVWLWPRRARRGGIVAVGAAALAAALLLGGATVTWLRARPFVTPPEMSTLARAGAVIEKIPPGTPLVFVVDNSSPAISFFATQAANAIRAAVAPARIRDVYVYVGSPNRYLAGRPTLVGRANDPAAVIHDALSRRYLADIRAAGGHPVAFVLRPFDPAGFRAARATGTGTPVAPGVLVLGRAPFTGAPPNDAVVAASSWSIVAVGVALTIVLGLVGLGWALAATADSLVAVAVAPSFGAAALLLGGVVADRLGAHLSGPTPVTVGAVIAVAGYAVAHLVRRAARNRHGIEPSPPPDAPEERHAEPAE